MGAALFLRKLYFRRIVYYLDVVAVRIEYESNVLLTAMRAVAWFSVLRAASRKSCRMKIVDDRFIGSTKSKVHALGYEIIFSYPYARAIGRSKSNFSNTFNVYFVVEYAKQRRVELLTLFEITYANRDVVYHDCFVTVRCVPTPAHRVF